MAGWSCCGARAASTTFIARWGFDTAASSDGEGISHRSRFSSEKRLRNKIGRNDESGDDRHSRARTAGEMANPSAVFCKQQKQHLLFIVRGSDSSVIRICATNVYRVTGLPRRKMARPPPRSFRNPPARRLVVRRMPFAAINRWKTDRYELFYRQPQAKTVKTSPKQHAWVRFIHLYRCLIRAVACPAAIG